MAADSLRRVRLFVARPSSVVVTLETGGADSAGAVAVTFETDDLCSGAAVAVMFKADGARWPAAWTSVVADMIGWDGARSAVAEMLETDLHAGARVHAARMAA